MSNLEIEDVEREMETEKQLAEAENQDKGDKQEDTKDEMELPPIVEGRLERENTKQPSGIFPELPGRYVSQNPAPLQLSPPSNLPSLIFIFKLTIQIRTSANGH